MHTPTSHPHALHSLTPHPPIMHTPRHTLIPYTLYTLHSPTSHPHALHSPTLHPPIMHTPPHHTLIPYTLYTLHSPTSHPHTLHSLTPHPHTCTLHSLHLTLPHITPSYLTLPHTTPSYMYLTLSTPYTPSHHTLIPYTPHTTHTPHQVMFKLGDDLRQDQLILQLITLMDRILRRENLDLKLTPYNVLACSSNHGKSNCAFHALFVLSTPRIDLTHYLLPLQSQKKLY